MQLLLVVYLSSTAITARYIVFLIITNGCTERLGPDDSRLFPTSLDGQLTTLLVAAYLAYGGFQVIDNDGSDDDQGLTLATFLSTIGLFRAFGGEFTAAYGLILRITSAYASIAQVTVFLNMVRRGQRRQE